VRVFCPHPASRARFIDELADLGLSIASAASAPAAVAEADLVICAARSRDETPTLHGEWIAEGATVISIGSTLPEQREVDVSVVARAGLIAADMVEEVAHDSGDMLAARRAGIAFESRLVSLSEVLSRPRSAAPAGGLRLYKSVGAALQDLVIAGICVARARQASRGTSLPVSIAPVLK
jgi:ornithine cyclodeaminase/alanine dehydrogenase